MVYDIIEYRKGNQENTFDYLFDYFSTYQNTEKSYL